MKNYGSIIKRLLSDASARCLHEAQWVVRKIIWFLNHLYSNHLDQAHEQISRTPFPLPQLAIHRKPETLFDYRFEDFEIVNYQSHPHIKAPVAV